MDEEIKYSPRMYWRYVRKNRIRAKLFAPYRAIPPLLTALAQFFLLRKGHPIRELLAIGGTICLVYFILFVLESLWKAIVITPSKIYGEQVDAIGELSSKNSFLAQGHRNPPISLQEKRRRELVSGKIKELGEIGRKILRYIHDQGQVNDIALAVDRQFDELSVNSFFAKAIPGGLVLHENHIVRVKPELVSALEFIFSSEYDKHIRD